MALLNDQYIIEIYSINNIINRIIKKNYIVLKTHKKKLKSKILDNSDEIKYIKIIKFINNKIETFTFYDVNNYNQWLLNELNE